jgi:Glycosyl transferase family 11
VIVVRLLGGHSNQLFQYATGRVLADRHNTSLKLDTKSYLANQPEQDTPREYELSGYPLRAEIATDKDMQRVLPLDFQPNLPFKILWRLGINNRIRPFSEGGKHFNPKVLSLPDNTYLNGWWQNEKYFMDIRKDLLRDLEPSRPMNTKNKKYFDAIKKSTSVSLHVRRGDYVTNKNAKSTHGLTPVQYYKAALNKVLNHENNKPVHIFVFSNDIPWCKKNLKLETPMTFIEGNVDGADDMRLMKHCNHNILTNSSFSWWGAWLNENPDKIVIAPKMWFTNKDDNKAMELPKTWIRL